MQRLSMNLYGEKIMKILQINSVCGIGSTGRIATDLDRLLKKNGYECTIAYGRGNAMNSETTIRIGNKFDNYLHVAKTRFFDQHGFGSKRSTMEFIKKLEEEIKNQYGNNPLESEDYTKMIKETEYNRLL